MIAVSQRCRKVSAARRRASGGGGFTLVEVLVALAILVILFSLLFAPMIVSLDMVTLGQSRVRMQDAVRTAMEEMRRELGNAMYVYPARESIHVGADGTYGTVDDVRMPLDNYSEIVFVSPAREAGVIVDPPAPRTEDVGGTRAIVATRFRAALVDASAAYSQDNPFVLVREEGFYTFGVSSFNPSIYTWTFDGGPSPLVNRRTPRRGYDIPVTTSICEECGDRAAGYATTCATCGSARLTYVHGNLQFRPERLIGEVLKPSQHNTLYRSRHPGWAGFDNPGNLELADLVLGASDLDPRILIYRSTDMYVMRDSFSPLDFSNVLLTWNSEAGVVQVGAPTVRPVTVTSPMAVVPVGSFYALNTPANPGDPGDDYDSTGSRTSGAITSDIVPVPDLAEAAATGVAMPSAYIVDPRMGGSEPAAKVVPGSVKVRVVATTATDTYQTTYTETTNLDQTEIGNRQFAMELHDYDRYAKVLFNKHDPPSPRLFDDDGDGVPDMALTSFVIYIEYYFRRNFDAAVPGNDDIIKADYSTRQVMNINLTLQRYVDPEQDPANPNALIIPADATLDRVSMQDQARVRNLGR